MASQIQVWKYKRTSSSHPPHLEPAVRAKATTVGNRQEKVLEKELVLSLGAPLLCFHFSWLEGGDILERDQGPGGRNRRVS